MYASDLRSSLELGEHPLDDRDGLGHGHRAELGAGRQGRQHAQLRRAVAGQPGVLDHPLRRGGRVEVAAAREVHVGQDPPGPREPGLVAGGLEDRDRVLDLADHLGLGLRALGQVVEVDETESRGGLDGRIAKRRRLGAGGLQGRVRLGQQPGLGHRLAGLDQEERARRGARSAVTSAARCSRLAVAGMSPRAKAR